MLKLNQRQINKRIDQIFQEKSQDFTGFLDEYKDNLNYIITAFSSRYADGLIDYAFAKNALTAIIAYLKTHDDDLNNYRAEIQDFYISMSTSAEDLKKSEYRNIVVDFTRFIKDELVDQQILSIESMLYIIFNVANDESVFFSYDEVTISLLLNVLRELFANEENKDEIAANYDLIQNTLNSPFAMLLGFDGLELHYLFVEQLPDSASIDTLMMLLRQACSNINKPVHKARASGIVLFCCKSLMSLDYGQYITTIVDLLESQFLPAAMLSFQRKALEETLFYYFRFKVLSTNSLQLLTSHPLVNFLIRGRLDPELKAKFIFFLLVTGSLSNDAKENLGRDKNLAESLFKLITSTQYGDIKGKQHAPFFIQWLFLLFLTSNENKLLFKSPLQVWTKMDKHRDTLLLALCHALASIEHNIVIGQCSADSEEHKKMLAEGRAFSGEKIASLNGRVYTLLDDSFARLGEQGCDELTQFHCSFFAEQPAHYTMILLSHAFFSALCHGLKSAAITPAFAAILGANPTLNERVYLHFQAHMLERKTPETKTFLTVVLYDQKSSLYHFFAGSTVKLDHFKKVLADVNATFAKAQDLTETTSTSTEAAHQDLSAHASDSSPVLLQASARDEWSDGEDESEDEIPPALPVPTVLASNDALQQQYHILGLQNNCCVNLAILEILSAITHFARKETSLVVVSESTVDYFKESYNKLKQVFAEYYEISEVTCTWTMLNSLFSQTVKSNLNVAQIILGPVFRHFIQRECIDGRHNGYEPLYELQEDGRYYPLCMEHASFFLYAPLGISLISHEKINSGDEVGQANSYLATNGFVTIKVYNTAQGQHWQRGEEVLDLGRDAMSRDYAGALNYLDDVSGQNHLVRVQEPIQTFKRVVNKSCQKILNPVRLSQNNVSVFEAVSDQPEVTLQESVTATPT